MSSNNKKFPDPSTVYPIPGVERLCFLKNIISNPQIIVGDYTYYDDPEGINNFEKNVLYLFDFIGDKLVIGKFCQIASNVQFIMNGANHPLYGLSTFPFSMLGREWDETTIERTSKGDTVIGNDVWIGNSAVFMPGVQIGDGAVIASHSLVSKSVEPYTIVGGNPAREIRKRFDAETIQFLLKLKWWDLPKEKIMLLMDVLSDGNLAALKQALGII